MICVDAIEVSLQDKTVPVKALVSHLLDNVEMDTFAN